MFPPPPPPPPAAKLNKPESRQDDPVRSTPSEDNEATSNNNFRSSRRVSGGIGAAAVRRPPPPPPPPPPRGSGIHSPKKPPQRIRRRPNPPLPRAPPPPPPPPRVASNKVSVPDVISSEELASKALDMFHKCLNRSIPTGNLYSGGLGAYYLLLEQSRYNLCIMERQRMHSEAKENNQNENNNSTPNVCQFTSHGTKVNTPFRCKRLLKQALEGAKEATRRFKRGNSIILSNQRGCISLLGGEWVGSHALLAVCYRRLEEFQEKQEQDATALQGNDTSRDNIRGHQSPAPSDLRSPGSVEDHCLSSSVSVSSLSIATARTTASMVKKPRSERVVARILRRLKKQHLFCPEEMEDDGTVRSSATAASETVLPVWNQDVLGGRAGALQTIFWLRNEFGKHSTTLGQDLVVSLAVKILREGLSTADSMGFHNLKTLNTIPIVCNSGRSDDNNYNAVLFWVCDSEGSLKTYLGAGRGVVGILHTLLGLHYEDWELIEEEVPNARRILRNTIDAFLPSARVSPASSDNSNGESGVSAKELMQPSLYHRLVYDMKTSTATSVSSPIDASRLPTTGSAFKSAGNLRPTFDASLERDTTAGWFHGATGLAMMFLEAAKVYRCKKYLLEAHRLCDAVVYPRGLRERTTIGATNFDNDHKYGKKGPVGLTGMALCFLQLSQLCSNDKEEGESKKKNEANKVSLPPNTSLRRLWKSRAMLYAQHAHHEWTKYVQSIPTTTGVWNAFSLYEGMGGLVSVLWQLSLSMFPDVEETLRTEIDPVVQMPLYSASYSCARATKHFTDASFVPILLSPKDVTFVATPDKTMPATSLSKSRRPLPAGLCPQRDPAESRRRRAAANAETQRRRKVAEEAERKKMEYAKAQRAIMNASRKAELEARRNAQLLARKRALEVAQRKEQQETKKNLENAEKKRQEERMKREALLLARKQAKERVDAKRKAKEEAELAMAKEEARMKAIETENKRKAAEQERKKRRAMMEARLRRQAKDAELAKQEEEKRKAKEAADRSRRTAELKQKEELRKKRNAEMRLRQLRALELAKEEERKRLIRVAAERELREKELRRKEEERKQQETERRRRLELSKQKRRKEEQSLAEKRATEMREREVAHRRAMEAKEKRRRQLRDEHVKKQRELHEQRLRDELQRALDKEVEKRQREEKDRQQAKEARKLLEERDHVTIDTSGKTDNPPAPQKNVYSPSFANRKKANPAHFSVPTRSSLFWSLQTDSNIGNSESYKPALVPTESMPQSRREGPSAASHLSSLTSSPGIAHISSVSNSRKDMQDSVLSHRTLSTAPPSTATEKINSFPMNAMKN
ncbi:unnamed protein product [Pseudo-nitzschia multistriata]|uniref:Uncharacterized protein n=1 Tax=Pseudo-nitzschia multistriata TaxID=183589 RepID=A0A448YWG9_9STRA|nr:unnamed protein product [Pseudo-nitzschia multistriata]